jgi:3,4-dihydroxyphthalate decarboxylase
VTVHTDRPRLRATVAAACRVLAQRGLVDGVLGHVSARVAEDELIVRCRDAEEERGLARTGPWDIWRVDLDGQPIDLPTGYAPPKELPIHAELMRARPEVGAVIHAHPPAALLAGLAGLIPRPVFGAYNIPALRLALDGVPIFDNASLVTSRELATELLSAMGEKSVCVMRGHGITVAAETVEQATVCAVNLEALLSVTVDLARLGVTPPDLSAAELDALPDLGPSFDDQLAWQALVAEADGG